MKRLLRAVFTFLKAVGRVLRQLFRRQSVLVSTELRQARLAECESNRCGRYSNGKCLECDCFVLAKVVLTTETCPLGRWPVDVQPAELGLAS